MIQFFRFILKKIKTVLKALLGVNDTVAICIREERGKEVSIATIGAAVRFTGVLRIFLWDYG